MLHSTCKKIQIFPSQLKRYTYKDYTANLMNGSAISNLMMPCHSFSLNRILVIHFYGLGFDMQEKGLVILAYRENKTKGFG